MYVCVCVCVCVCVRACVCACVEWLLCLKAAKVDQELGISFVVTDFFSVPCWRNLRLLSVVFYIAIAPFN